jgi:hypothetical protein
MTHRDLFCSLSLASAGMTADAHAVPIAIGAGFVVPRQQSRWRIV